MMGGSKAGGFTIVETLIVLAISGGMLMSVVFMVSGQQAKSQFQQAINAAVQQLQQTIDDVANGYYPVSNISCSASGSSVSITSAPGSSIGTNSDCVLVGKAIQFYQLPVPQQYTVYSMVSLRTGSSVIPIAIAPGTAAGTHSTVPDRSTKISLGNGLSFVSATYASAPTPSNTAAFAILTSNAFNSGGVPDISGAQSVKLYAIKLTDATSPSTTNVESIDKINISQDSTTGYSICLASGTTNQSGLISIGGSNSRKLSVTLTIKDGKVC